MRIDKQHPLWKAAPWHVKFGAIGLSTYESVGNFAVGCFIAACIGVVAALIAALMGSMLLSLQLFPLATFGIGAYLYATTQIWLLQNREVLT